MTNTTSPVTELIFTSYVEYEILKGWGRVVDVDICTTVAESGEAQLDVSIASHSVPSNY